MFAMTHNVVDYVYCIMFIMVVIMYVVARAYLNNRRAKYMGWSPTRTYLNNMSKEYNRYYR